jgi:formiminotetrahydrofolate cyclodeaminase
MPAAVQRAQAQGRGATAHESERTHAASSAKVEAAKTGPKTPGELLTQNKKLSDKLSTILKHQNPPVTDLQAASQGFRNLGQFVAAVHVSQNLGIPFDQLKTQEQTSGSLGKAIHVLKPDADPKAEVMKAAEQAVDDMQSSQPGS